MMYPDWQFWYWFRSVFYKESDFLYREEKTGRRITPGSWRKTLSKLVGAGALVGVVSVGTGVVDLRKVVDGLKRMNINVLVGRVKGPR
jgi:hypothetical protein